MRRLSEAAAERPVLYDGSKGSLLQTMGLAAGEASEAWNVERPDAVREVYERYAAAGAEVIQTNTFPGNRLSLAKYGLGDRMVEINREGVALAREVAGRDRWVCASVGPTGEMFAPAGELTFERAYEVFAEQLRAVEDAGADAVNFETFSDIAELRAAVIAARETTRLEVIASATFEAGGRTMSGNPPEAVALVGQCLGAELVGANCSTGPREMVPVIEAMAPVASVPLAAKPNAGFPEIKDGRLVYLETPERFASFANAFLEAGVRLLGGCCGTTPAFVAELRDRMSGLAAPRARPFQGKAICSARRLAHVDERLVLARVEVTDGDADALVDVVAEAEADGAGAVLLRLAGRWSVGELAATLGLYAAVPVVFDVEDPDVLRTLLRLYPGRAGVVGSAPESGAGPLVLDRDFLAALVEPG
jgi:5-methyltetrahydrofolate--homocysteine methyltransferase